MTNFIICKEFLIMNLQILIKTGENDEIIFKEFYSQICIFIGETLILNISILLKHLVMINMHWDCRYRVIMYEIFCNLIQNIRFVMAFK